MLELNALLLLLLLWNVVENELALEFIIALCSNCIGPLLCNLLLEPELECRLEWSNDIKLLMNSSCELFRRCRLVLLGKSTFGPFDVVAVISAEDGFGFVAGVLIDFAADVVAEGMALSNETNLVGLGVPLVAAEPTEDCNCNAGGVADAFLPYCCGCKESADMGIAKPDGCSMLCWDWRWCNGDCCACKCDCDCCRAQDGAA
mmetsp:Transcript_28163/g.79010  ORF Transcript_28163/g.79010 Transcript_28163/m.79010 type:complete len:203 (+) Transcript_28163:1444-2052(+)